MSALAAVGDFLGGLASNYTNYRIADMANKTQIELANTAMQRRVKDLAAAGLNPMMAVQQGGAATPTMNVPKMDNPASSAIATYQAARLNEAQVNQVNSSTAAAEAQARKTRAEADIIEASVPNAALKAGYDIEILGRQADKLLWETTDAINKAKISQIQVDRDQVTLDQLKTMQPLLVEYQKIVNSYQQAGLTQAQAEAKFFSDHEWAKPLQILKSLLPSLGGISAAISASKK